VLDRVAARARVEAGQLSAAAVEAVIAEEEKVRDLLERQGPARPAEPDEPKNGKKGKKKNK
jgi:hypothetical protein